MFQHEMLHEKSLKTSKAHSDPMQAPLSLGNQDLLGNSFREASSGFQTAEAPSFSAFDAASGQTLSPMSAGSAAPASFSAPVQAKKGGGGHRHHHERAPKPQKTWEQLVAEDKELVEQFHALGIW